MVLLFRTLLVPLLLAMMSTAWGVDQEPVKIRLHDRVLCLGLECTLQPTAEGPDTKAPFGTLLKVSEIRDERCFVYNQFMEGWIDTQKLRSLSDEQIPVEIGKANVPQAEKEYALGNYFLRRDLTTARKHFEKATELDDGLDHPYVALACLLAKTGEKDAIQSTLQQLKRFPNREDVALYLELQGAPTPETQQRCIEVVKSSSFLKFAVAEYLLYLEDERALPTAHKLAFEAFDAQRFNPERSKLVAEIVYRIRSKVQDHPENMEKATMMVIEQWIHTFSSDRYFADAYEALASIFANSGMNGKAIRAAQRTILFDPRSHVAPSVIAQFVLSVERGETLKDPAGMEIKPIEIVLMPEIAKGLQSIENFDLPLLPEDRREEDLRLHGWTRLKSGREVDEAGNSPLHLLVKTKNALCIAYLANHYLLDWNCLDADGNAVVHVAAIAGDLTMLHFLSLSGVDLSFQSTSGDTALAIACRNSDLALVTRIARGNRISEQDMALLRKYCSLPNDASLSAIRKVTYERLVAHLERNIVKDLAQLVNSHTDAVMQAQAEQQPKEDLYVLKSDAPISYPMFITDIGSTNPDRAKKMIHQRIAQEVAEELKLQEHLRNPKRWQSIQTEEQTADLQRKSELLADQTLRIAYFSFTPEEFQTYCHELTQRMPSISFQVLSEISESNP